MVGRAVRLYRCGMTLTVSMVTCDTDDPASLATWWAEQTGSEVVNPHDGTFVKVVGGSVRLGFQRGGSSAPGKNRLHLDLRADDIDVEVERLLAAGAGLVARRGDDSFRWVTLTDPAGNEFCVTQ